MSGRTCFVDRIVLGLWKRACIVAVHPAADDSWIFLATFRTEFGKHVVVLFENEVQSNVKLLFEV